jgi:hypothetical protein
MLGGDLSCCKLHDPNINKAIKKLGKFLNDLINV